MYVDQGEYTLLASASTTIIMIKIASLIWQNLVGQWLMWSVFYPISCRHSSVLSRWRWSTSQTSPSWEELSLDHLTLPLKVYKIYVRTLLWLTPINVIFPCSFLPFTYTMYMWVNDLLPVTITILLFGMILILIVKLHMHSTVMHVAYTCSDLLQIFPWL